MTFAHDYAVAAPEIFLAIASMVLLMIGVYRGNGATRLLSWLAVLCFAITLAMVLQADPVSNVSFAGMYVAEVLASPGFDIARPWIYTDLEAAGELDLRVHYYVPIFETA
ncbi:MAG: hypothetical protein OSB82_17075, partial [Alphaproteobacteria bacterium]|nr:hypothetical protein [Alphaproteobacteria bacterium]